MAVHGCLTVPCLACRPTQGTEVVEIGAYGQAMQEISNMRSRFAVESQAHARKARALRAIEDALNDPRWRDDVDGEWLESVIRRALP